MGEKIVEEASEDGGDTASTGFKQCGVEAVWCRALRGVDAGKGFVRFTLKNDYGRECGCWCGLDWQSCGLGGTIFRCGRVE